jgi:hypothetical protein
MTKLNTSPNIADPDGFYNTLIQLHENLSAEQSQKLNARLLLLLANHIGDTAVLNDALAIAGAEDSE